MALTPTAVADLAADLLDSVVDRFAGHGVSLPTRQFITAGEVALDCCDQLAVTVTDLTHTFPRGIEEIVTCSPPRHVSLDVWLTRCAALSSDDGTAPTAAALTAKAVEVLTDMWVLAYVLWEGYDAGDWGGTCSAVVLGPVIPYGPDSCAGSHGSVHVLFTGGPYAAS